jgi:Ti-type conjugative transfer relaxase TraA
MESKVYDWSRMEKPVHHDVLLPVGACDQYKNPTTLWNAVEQAENRKDSQVALDLVLALPDDECVSLEEKIELSRSFVQKHFIDRGLAAQFDVHRPDKRGIGEEGDLRDHNWHAHILLTTRRFGADGISFGLKAKDLMPQVFKGRVVAGENWGKLWGQHQNQFFEEKGMSLRVDPSGVISQEHLGPVRMRGRAFSLFEAHGRNVALNQELSADPASILKGITATNSVFSTKDVESFISKHVPSESVASVKQSFFGQAELVPLLERGTGKPTELFTSSQVVQEEARIVRLSDRIAARPALTKRGSADRQSAVQGLTGEQKTAFDGVVSNGRLACIQGYAGVGKSRLLGALREYYESGGYTVRGMGPDNATAEVLKEKGFSSSENVHRFLFALSHDKRSIKSGREVWMVDEAGKLGNGPLQELLKEADRRKVQVLFSGDVKQISSVERGGMFSHFCKRYGSHDLEDIQRQKTEEQRQMARSLAIGEIAGAIDRLHSLKGIRFCADKGEAMESLVRQWAIDSELYGKGTSMVIARSNSEVRVLNELVRGVRKERGEISGEEFLCETSCGKVYLSVGDKIQFRKNDRELGVTNGLQGVLSEASEKRLKVSIESPGGKVRVVEFDPRKYAAYQPGYASTYYRSQGSTVSRAYVLYGKGMDRASFYVGLTRHVNSAQLYVDGSATKNLAQLKQSFLRTGEKLTTAEFTTAAAIETARAEDRVNERIASLKEGETISEAVKGYGWDAWRKIQSTAKGAIDPYLDRARSAQFYSPKREQENVQAGVVRVTDSNESEGIDVAKMAKGIVSETAHSESVGANLPIRDESVVMDGALPKGISRLSDDSRVATRHYFDLCTKCSTLLTMVDAQAERQGGDRASTQDFSQWQSACGSRNEGASNLLRALSRNELTQALGKKSASIVVDQAKRYEEATRSSETRTGALEAELRTCASELAYRLFPEGPTRREPNRLRFGQNGSLAVTVRGDKAGCFYDFENKEGGGPIQLIQRKQGLEYSEARRWAADFVGRAESISVPRAFNCPKSAVRGGEWQSCTPDPKVPAPDKGQVGGGLTKAFKEVDRYPYRGVNGDLLFYTVRMEDRNDSSSKRVLPLTYGKWKSGTGRLQWTFKGYTGEKRPVYGQERLSGNPGATVLVVEGEKTANAAQLKLGGESLVCVTWCGGAGAVAKTDWSVLCGRNVVIWPDNDPAGFKAAKALSQELRLAGSSSIKVVSEEKLTERFRLKWDLADKIPEGLKDVDVIRLIGSAKETSVSLPSFFSHLKANGAAIDPKRQEDVSFAVDVLAKVEARLIREQGGVANHDIGGEVLNETTRLIISKGAAERALMQEFGLRGAVLEKMARTTIASEAEGKAFSSVGREAVLSKIRGSQLAASPVINLVKEPSVARIELEHTTQPSAGIER